MIVMNSGSQLSKLYSVSQMSQVYKIIFVIAKMVQIVKNVNKKREKIKENQICQKSQLKKNT